MMAMAPKTVHFQCAYWRNRWR